MFSVRGAVTVESDSRGEVLQATKELLSEAVKRNSIALEDITSITFTATRDIKSVYPAVAAREIGIVHAGLMCFQEMYVEGSLERCIRVMLLVNGDRSQNEVKHVYLRGAEILRPDLLSK